MKDIDVDIMIIPESYTCPGKTGEIWVWAIGLVVKYFEVSNVQQMDNSLHVAACFYDDM